MTMQGRPFGNLVRHWRRARGLSQEALAMSAGMSVRHLSFIETGRSQPSREAALAIAEALGVRDSGTFLEAAGYLAPYAPVDLAAPEMRPLATELGDIVRHQRDPALIHDRFGTILRRNAAFDRLVQHVGGDPIDQEIGSGHRLLGSVRPMILNWDALAVMYRRRLFLELVRGTSDVGDEVLGELYRTWQAEAAGEVAPPLLFPLELQHETATIRLRFLTSTLGTPQDIPLRNFRLVVVMPADAASRRILDAMLD
jgi:transcriptional regulator with XRE-family HTH domain